ncbi:hypothetical protein DL764_001075 [Monosporascus ibericus]|uniref:Beta-mannosidase B n=1 Tax=Monosporascus ibericus TaxID=155417 RepID=A0A4Q4TR66_9PEZI|nr:hypothetical protein DL764_001075 [Monosporascus ibericus]
MAFSKHPLDSGWEFRQKDDDSANSWLPARRIPSEVHLDLLANGKIPDPFLDLNELSVRWIADKDWVYRTQFAQPKKPAASEPTVTDLVFEGLDTFATVSLNGTEILKSDNMFLSHRVEVSKLLQDQNFLEITFDSARMRGLQLVEEHSHEHTFYVRQTEVSRIPVRKAQYHWGWDWGPILTTAGPWRPIYLEQYTVRVADVWAQINVNSDLKSCSGLLFAKVDGGYTASRKATLSIALDGETVFEKTCDVDENGLAQTEFNLSQPKLWYPHGYGTQTRYALMATVSSYDKKSKLIGFRRTELIQEKDDYGKSFYFRINGIDVFAGGSCWIPADSFVSQISGQRYHDWMKLMIEGNQIMARVWGGGIYEAESMIDACDELGILVWHDFQFACGSYPTYPSYLESIEQEAREAVRRYRMHPSLLIWAGSNEDYQVQERYQLDYNYEDKDPQSWLRSSFPARYTYEYLLPKIVKEEDPFALYHATSPWGDGKPTADPTVGDIHQWNIWHGAMNRYQECSELGGRFVSEFGMEAYPHLETIRNAITSPRQQHPGSMAMDFRNKAIDHERRMATYVTENFLVKYDLASYTHLTQVVQAETMHMAYKTWRRDWGREGSRKCGGVLVWQLNDCWPTMSWAVVDYHLVKKPAYYAISRALEPVAVGISTPYRDWTSGHADPRGLTTFEKFDLWIASSKVHPVNLDLTVRIISIRTGEDVQQPMRHYAITALPNSTTEVLRHHAVASSEKEASKIHQPYNITQDEPIIIHAVIKAEGKVLASDTCWPQPLKYLDFSDRGVTFKSTSPTQLTISVSRPVKGFVIEETRATKLSDNGFDIIPGEDRVINVEGGGIDDLKYTYVGSPESSVHVKLSA